MATIYDFAAHQAHPPRRRRSPVAAPLCAPTAAEADLYDLRARVIALESRERQKDEQIASLARELSDLKGQLNPLPASWGGPGGEALTLDEIRNLLALAEAMDRADVLREGA